MNPSNTAHSVDGPSRIRRMEMSFGEMQPLKYRLRSLSKRLDKVRYPNKYKIQTIIYNQLESSEYSIMLF